MDPSTTLFDQLVLWLRNPATYQDGSSSVDFIETHISCVFLTERFAYKLKKPIQFEFLDFSTADARRRACEVEVRLNRRLTTNVYLSVVPINQDQLGQFSFGGDGPAVDWLVKMRRLDSADTLAQRIESSRISGDEVEAMIALLTAFYQSAERPAMSAARYREMLFQHVRANHLALLASHPNLRLLVRRVHQRQLKFLALQGALLDQRVAEGCIVDGHGDLRPEHIFLEQPPQIIDCIEFSAEYRWLDIADEICFLSMECERLGARSLGGQLLTRCQERFPDHWPQPLVNFYRAYRACVRAKVAALRAAQLTSRQPASSPGQAQQYLELADAYLTTDSRPALLLVGGLMGSGKSTLASAIGAELGIDVLSTDAIRRELFAASVEPADYGKGLYRPQNRARVYDELFRRASDLLRDGLSVVLDGTFLSTESKARAVEAAARHGASVAYLRCTCPDDVALARIEDRSREGTSMSDARPELLALQRQEDEPHPPGLYTLEIDTTQPTTDQVAQACRFLGSC